MRDTRKLIKNLETQTCLTLPWPNSAKTEMTRTRESRDVGCERMSASAQPYKCSANDADDSPKRQQHGLVTFLRK
jgi:hypothetical protein